MRREVRMVRTRRRRSAQLLLGWTRLFAEQHPKTLDVGSNQVPSAGEIKELLVCRWQGAGGKGDKVMVRIYGVRIYGAHIWCAYYYVSDISGNI